MAKFNFHVDRLKVKVTEADWEEVVKSGGSAFLLENLLAGLIAVKTQNSQEKGLSGVKRKVYTRILEKLDNSTDDTVDLEKAELDFLKEIFSDNTVIHPAQTRIFSIMEKALEEASKE